jgi:hypothetical protein
MSNEVERRPVRLPRRLLALKALGLTATLATSGVLVTLVVYGPISIDVGGKVEGHAKVIVGTPGAVEREIDKLPIPAVEQRIAAFPGAEGWGTLATHTGGWSIARVERAGFLPIIAATATLAADPCDRTNIASTGVIHFVTNTNDSGAGSLRDILENQVSSSVMDFVIFRTGGTITLSSGIDFKTACVYIAGQTAPGDGILLRAPNMGGNIIRLFNASDHVIIRYIRVRHGRDYVTNGGPCGACGGIRLTDTGGTTDYILDHVSVSWALDGNMGIWRTDSTTSATQRITFQRSICSEMWKEHSTCNSVGGRASHDANRQVYKVSIHHMLYANNGQRNPEVDAGWPSSDPDLGVEVINVVRYNWTIRPHSSQYPAVIDLVNNYSKPGPATSTLVHRIFRRSFVNNAADTLYSLYIAGDTIEGESFASQWDHLRDWQSLGDSLNSGHQRLTRLPQPPVPVSVESAAAAYTDVLNDVGANQRLDCDGSWLNAQDDVDARVIAQVQNDSGPAVLYNDVSDVGGWPTMDTGTACTDTDSDGMPDTWEDANGLDKADATDALQDDDGDGYTNLEEYLNGTTP